MPAPRPVPTASLPAQMGAGGLNVRPCRQTWAPTAPSPGPN